jgi:hypothetical protein
MGSSVHRFYCTYLPSVGTVLYGWSVRGAMRLMYPDISRQAPVPLPRLLLFVARCWDGEFTLR